MAEMQQFQADAEAASKTANIDVVFVADVDCITWVFFSLRERPTFPRMRPRSSISTT